MGAEKQGSYKGKREIKIARKENRFKLVAVSMGEAEKNTDARKNTKFRKTPMLLVWILI